MPSTMNILQVIHLKIAKTLKYGVIYGTIINIFENSKLDVNMKITGNSEGGEVNTWERVKIWQPMEDRINEKFRYLPNNLKITERTSIYLMKFFLGSPIMYSNILRNSFIFSQNSCTSDASVVGYHIFGPNDFNLCWEFRIYLGMTWSISSATCLS